MSRIFLSHSSENNPAAIALADWLSEQGWSDYFLDISEDRGIAPGERWMRALAEAVDRCEAVIFLISPAWRDSKYCFAEFYQAKNLGKRIFGVIVEKVDLSQLPEQLTSEWQVCNLTGNDDLISFSIERVSLVPPTVVRFSKSGLNALARGLRKAGLNPSNFVWPPDNDPERSPFPGLRSLDELDAAVFFGRDAAIVRAIDQIRLLRERDIERLFVILGASGAGKSSFLRAGILSRLARDSDHFLVLPTIRPDRAAISGSKGLLACLHLALAKVGHNFGLAELRIELSKIGLTGLLQRIEPKTRVAGDLPGIAPRTLIIPIDQAEELFASDAGQEARQLLLYIDALRQELSYKDASRASADLRVLFIVTIRSDSLAYLQSEGALEGLLPVLFSLPAMPASEFKAVIEGPAQRHSETVKSLVISPELTEQLVMDATGADALPLLALTLEWLYRDFTTTKGTRLGLMEYEQLGGVSGVINKAVIRALEHPSREPAIPSQSAEQDRLLGSLFPFLATVDPDSGEWKRRVALRTSILAAEPQLEALMERLTDQRLLLTDSRNMGEETHWVEVVEVAHEALLRQWGAMEQWLRTFAADLAVVESVRRAALEWQRKGRDEVLLVHTAHRLHAAEALVVRDQFNGRFEPISLEYLAACRDRDRLKLKDREEKLRQMTEQQAKLSELQTKRASMQRRVSWGLSMGLTILLFLGAWTLMQSRELSRQTSFAFASAAEAAVFRNEADRGVRFAILALRDTFLQPAHVTARPTLALAMNNNALRVLILGQAGRNPAAVMDGQINVSEAINRVLPSARYTVDGRRILTTSIDQNDDRTIFQVWDAVSGVPVGKPIESKALFYTNDISPNGERVVRSDSSDTLRVWDTSSAIPVGSPISHSEHVNSARFSPDGSRMITASTDKTAQIWDASTGKPIGKPMLHKESVDFASYSPDGNRVVTTSAGIARIWDAFTGAPIGKPMLHKGIVNFAIFSPDGKHVVTSSSGRIARIWDVLTGKPIGNPMEHEGDINSASISPSGKFIVTASSDKTVQVWEALSGNPIGRPLVLGEIVNSVKFSPDGKYILAVSDDGSAAVWDVFPEYEFGYARWRVRHESAVTSGEFSPDGTRVITASEDNSFRVWKLEDDNLLGQPISAEERFGSLNFSPNGKLIVTASADGTARIWDALTGKPIGKPMLHKESVNFATFNPDGNKVITASGDGTARIWDALAGKPIGKPMLHKESVDFASYSPDGNRVITTSAGIARIWDALTDEPIGDPMVHAATNFKPSFSPESLRLVTALDESTVQIRDALTGKPIGGPMAHKSWVASARFSPSGKQVVTASWDNTAQIWNAVNGKPIGEPFVHSGAVISASFSSDGMRLVTGSNDRTAQIWDVLTGKAVGESMVHKSNVASAIFSPSGDQVVTFSPESGARIWDAATGKPTSRWLGNGYDKGGILNEGFMHAKFSPDEGRVAALSLKWNANGAGPFFIHIWDTKWSAVRGPHLLIAEACARMNPLARQITLTDRKWLPSIPKELLGKDVCNEVPTLFGVESVDFVRKLFSL